MSYAGPASRATKQSLRVEASRRGQKTSSADPLDRLRARALERANQRRSPSVVFLAGIAVGAVIGAGVALLLAPQTGQDTRRALLRGSRRLSHRGRDAWDDLRVELKRAVRKRRRAKADRATSNL